MAANDGAGVDEVTAGYAVVRELWYARDAIARDRDISAGRIASDKILMEIAHADPRTIGQLPQGHRPIARYGRQWSPRSRSPMTFPSVSCPNGWCAATVLPCAQLGGQGSRGCCSPQRDTRRVGGLRGRAPIPIENVCSPEPLRRVVWTPPTTYDTESFEAALLAEGCPPLAGPDRGADARRRLRRLLSPGLASGAWTAYQPSRRTQRDGFTAKVADTVITHE